MSQTQVAEAPGDGDAFAAQALASDLEELSAHLVGFLAAVSPSDWARPTDRHPGAWTLREALAHVVAFADGLLRSLEGALAGDPYAWPDLTSREDLPAVNARDIADRSHLGAKELVGNLTDTLDRTVGIAARLNPRQLKLSVKVAAYNRSLVVAELLGFQLVHPGIVHAAQLANGFGVKPLWVRYPPELMHRQLTRLFSIASHSYWPERGGDRVASINLIVGGPAGGRWFLSMNPDGGSSGEGRAEHQALTVRAANAAALCRAFTFQVSPLRAALTGQMLAWGDLRLLLRMPHLFAPTSEDLVLAADRGHGPSD